MMNKALAFAALTMTAASAVCPPANLTTQAGFDLDAYVAKTWYAQEQMEISYLPADYNFCVTANYRRESSLLGYTIRVSNFAQNAEGKKLGPITEICAQPTDEENGQLRVAPCFLPPALAGPYWIIAYSETEGYALVSGGAPAVEGENGLCQTGQGVNDSGFWIFTRGRERDEALVGKVRKLAEGKGYDLSVLNQIDQTNCTTSS